MLLAKCSCMEKRKLPRQQIPPPMPTVLLYAGTVRIAGLLADQSAAGMCILSINRQVLDVGDLVLAERDGKYAVGQVRNLCLQDAYWRIGVYCNPQLGKHTASAVANG